MNILGSIKVTRCLGGVVAGTGDTQDGTAIDMQGYEGVVFIADCGTLSSGAVTDLRAQDSTNNSTFADVAGSKQSWAQATDSNTSIVLDIYKPLKRYVKPRITRATANAVINGIWAIQYQSRDQAVTQDTTVSHHNALVSPADGTA